ncbi:MAG: DNA translocase FtsK [Pyrinomonadaceae bacterium]
MATEVEKQAASKTHSRSNEIIAIVLLALTVLIFLSLVTYSPNDWSLNTSSSQKTHNWVGTAGSVIADLLFQTIGLTAYFLPALMILIAWRFFRSEELRVSISRVIGYILFVVSVSGLAELLGFYGGILGAFFERNLTRLLGNIGTGILLSAIFAASVLLITNLSLDSFFGNFRLAWENFRVHFDERLNKWREQRKVKQAASARLEKLNEARNENFKEKNPTISAGKIVSADVKEEKKSVADKFSSVFKRWNKTSEAVAETSVIVGEKKNSENSEAINKPSDKKVENILPTIEETRKDFESETPDIFSEAEKIPITPIQNTGELDADLLEEFDDKPQEKPAKKTNFNDYILPEAEFLTPPPPRIEQKDEELLSIAQELTDKTKEFNVTGRVMHICQGPVVTTYEFKPDPGVKYSRVTSLSDDLCLALKSESIRIERIPGKAFVGIEVPNRERETIFLREVIESKKFRDSKSLLTLALGKTIDGLNYVADLAKMPHLLIAGATGAGKSVGVNTLVVSILYKAKPDEVKFIMVDPKRLELGLYADIPHLATPIITDPKRAAISLKWAVSEMEKRYKDLAGWGVRNIDGFNTEVKKCNANEEFDDNGEPFKPLPYIVIIIDELADLMMVSGKEVEESITRLAQMARAVGIHLVLATQRPSVDVITGLIKANFPARISFRVSSKIDSRTIIDGNGAESLLGKGDMLFLPPATSQIVRVHGAFVDEKEIAKIVEHIKAQGNPEYDSTITKSEEEIDDSGDLPGRKDVLFVDALRTVVSSKSASTSLLQRHLRIGYGRAAAILDAMAHEGYIGEMDGSKRARPILQKAYDDLQEAEEGREL